jgi:S-methylmethionine-dependent homocysteine/selenocysteine methylase
MTFENLLKNKFILLDGGFGTELIKKGVAFFRNTFLLDEKFFSVI